MFDHQNFNEISHQCVQNLYYAIFIHLFLIHLQKPALQFRSFSDVIVKAFRN